MKSNFKITTCVVLYCEWRIRRRLQEETIKVISRSCLQGYALLNILNIFFYLKNVHPLVDSEWEKNIFKDLFLLEPFFIYLFIFIVIVMNISKISTSLFTSAIHKSFSSSPCQSIIVAHTYLLNSHCLLCISTRRTTVIMMMRGRK